MAGTKKPTTRSGAPSAAARKATGGGKGMKPGSFPVSTAKQAAAAIDLRGHAPNPNAVLNKVARSPYASNPTVKAKLAKARSQDAKKK